jgi:hypothetical protein
MKCHICKSHLLRNKVLDNEFYCECDRLFKSRMNAYIIKQNNEIVFYNLCFHRDNNVYVVLGRSLDYDRYQFTRLYKIITTNRGTNSEQFVLRLNQFQPLSSDYLDTEANLLFDKMYNLSLFA